MCLCNRYCILLSTCKIPTYTLHPLSGAIFSFRLYHTLVKILGCQLYHHLSISPTNAANPPPRHQFLFHALSSGKILLPNDRTELKVGTAMDWGRGISVYCRRWLGIVFSSLVLLFVLYFCFCFHPMFLLFVPYLSFSSLVLLFVPCLSSHGFRLMVERQVWYD